MRGRLDPASASQPLHELPLSVIWSGHFFAFNPISTKRRRARCLLDLIEIGLQIFADLNERECANWRTTISGALDQVVQIGAEFVRGFDRIADTHLELPRSLARQTRIGRHLQMWSAPYRGFRGADMHETIWSG